MTVILRDNSSPTPANGSQSSYFDKVEIDFFYVSLQNMREFTLRNWSLYIWLRYTITQCLQNLPVSMKNKTIRRIIAWSNLTAIVIFMLRKWRRKTRKWNYSDAHKQYDQCQPKLIYMRLPIYQRLQRVYIPYTCTHRRTGWYLQCSSNCAVYYEDKTEMDDWI